uniref:glycosyltransferase n=1 Tax=Anaerovibrio lipolyticus TaxID=82374 RepID=UPI0023F3CB9C
MGIKITACTITKNEEKNLPSWLACMQEVADEIIVVDTGSTDATVEIAKEAVGKVYYFKWINDFAAAKNYAIEQATGDWILFLDADETFTQTARKVLRQELERYNRDKAVGCLLCRMLDVDADNDNRVFNTGMLPRIFRHTPYIRYRGAIHEQVENSRGNMKMLFAEKLEFIHTGYSRSIVKAKTERNLPIMLEELDKATTDKERRRLYPYLMDAYNTLGDNDKVIYYARECISNGHRMVGAPGHFYEVMCMSMYNAGKTSEEVLATVEEAEGAFPDDPFFPFVRSMVLDRDEDLIGSEKAALQGLKLRKVIEDKMARGSGEPDTARGFVPYVYERLGKFSAMKHKYQQAADYCLLALKYHKKQTAALQWLCRIFKDSDDVELIQLLNTIYDREEDGDYLVRSLKGLASYGVLAYYGQSVKDSKEAYIFMAGGRYDSGAVKLGQRYKELCQLGVLSAYNTEKFPEDGYLDILLGSDYKKNLQSAHTSEGKILKRLKDYRLRNKLDSISFPEDDMPKVSIMIPTYNRPELFERTLMSAINQTYPNV